LPRDPLAAAHALAKLIDLWEKFSEENPATPGFQSDLAAAYNIVAEMQVEFGQRDEALVTFERARAGWDRLARDHPTVPEYRADLARTCEALAWFLPRPERSQEADEAARSALALREQLASEFPDVPQYRLDRAESLKNLGDQATRAGQLQEAEKAYRRSVGLCRELADKFPTVALYGENLIVSQNELIKLLESTGQVSDQQAEQSRLLAIEAIAKLARAFPTDDFFPLHLALRYRDLAFFLGDHGRPKDAIAAYRQAKQFLESLANDHPSHSYYLSLLANANLDLGELLAGNRQFEEGEKLCRRAIDLFAKLVAEFPANKGYTRDLEECRRRMAAAVIEGKSPSNTDTVPESTK
ncbi:MAG: hypothetical protein HY288_13365, partial [Planctomycetia bacterium]|nr:hypothetical protein [Planctomycetia bacterium]